MNFFSMTFFCFQKCGIASLFLNSPSHIAHQISIAGQAESRCDVKIGNLQGLKAGGDVLFDNFLNMLDKINLKCGVCN